MLQNGFIISGSLVLLFAFSGTLIALLIRNLLKEQNLCEKGDRNRMVTVYRGERMNLL